MEVPMVSKVIGHVYTMLPEWNMVPIAILQFFNSMFKKGLQFHACSLCVFCSFSGQDLARQLGKHPFVEFADFFLQDFAESQNWVCQERLDEDRVCNCSRKDLEILERWNGNHRILERVDWYDDQWVLCVRFANCWITCLPRMSGIPRTEYPRWQFLDIAWLGKAAVPGLRIGRRRRHLQASHTNYHWDASFRAMVPWYHGKTWWMPQKTRLLCAVQDQVACGGSRSATGYSVSGRICCSISLQPSSKLRPVVRHLVASSLAKLVYNSNNLGLWLIYLYIFYRFPIWFINIYKLGI